jgi:membrane protein DedA with SNARE-associated domain
VVTASILSHVTDAITAAIGDHGVYAVFLLMMIDAVLPAASELVMVYAGALAAGAFADEHVILFGERIESEIWAFVTMVAAGTIGYTLGAVGGWAIGLYGGRPYLERHGRWLHLGPERLKRAERWFDRWGDATALVGRITPVARSFVSIPAGVFRMALGRYTVLTFIGSTAWCLAFAGIGWAVGSNWETFHENFHYVDYAVLALLLAGGIWLLIRRRRSSRLARRAADPAG